MLVTTPRSMQSSEAEDKRVLHQGKSQGRKGKVVIQGLSWCNFTKAWSMSIYLFIFNT